MSAVEHERRHTEVALTGFRAYAASVGMVQLVKELRRSGVLDDDAVARVRDAIADELTLARPLRADPESFRDRIRERLDRLFAPER